MELIIFGVEKKLKQAEITNKGLSAKNANFARTHSSNTSPNRLDLRPVIDKILETVLESFLDNAAQKHLILALFHVNFLYFGVKKLTQNQLFPRET